MTGDEIEAAIAALLGSAAASPGLVITVRRHEEYASLLEEIRRLEDKIRSKDREISKLNLYPVLYLRALDELREARRLLQQFGFDTSFMTSLSPLPPGTL